MFQFTPIRKDKPRGHEIRSLSAVPGAESVVFSGPNAGKTLVEVCKIYKEKLVGQHVREQYGFSFPLLIKFITANERLSVQVHPDDTVAQKRHNCLGKTEMRYITQATEDAALISGFKKPTTKEEYVDYLNKEKLPALLCKEPAQPNDVFFIPPGKVHAIGPGLMLAEIQQTSDITYRMYDRGRVDAEGKGRQLHTEEALEVLDFSFQEEQKTAYEKPQNKEVCIANCPYFTTMRREITQPITCAAQDSFQIMICIEGFVQCQYEGEKEIMSLAATDVCLCSANKNIQITPNEKATVLVVRIESTK